MDIICDPTNGAPTWVPSTGKGNMCGFATFVLGFNTAIIEPDLFTAHVNQDFLNLYKKELKIEAAADLTKLEADCKHDPIQIQLRCAPALKIAFAKTLQADHDLESNPFYKIFEINLGTFLATLNNNDGITDLNDYGDYISNFIEKSNKDLMEAYNAYEKFITGKYVEQAEISNALIDSTSFCKYLRTHPNPNYIKIIKEAIFMNLPSSKKKSMINNLDLIQAVLKRPEILHHQIHLNNNKK